MSRKMKDSGIEWIGEIPEAWKLVFVKYLFVIGRGRVIAVTELEDDGKYPVYSSQTLNDGCFGYLNTFDFEKSQLTWTTDGANAGTVFFREGRHNCTNVCGTLQPKTNDNLKYLKFCLEYIAFYHKRQDTNGFKIMNNEMANIKLVLPTINEQTYIANYLNTRCTLIDQTIEKQKQVIEKLKEYKQSVITEAVTKGLNQNVLMKDSGSVYWGEMPENWTIKRLKYVFSIVKRIAGKEGYNVLSITQNGIKVKDLSNNEGQIAQDYSNYQLVEVGDFAMNHMDLLTGWVDVSKYNGVTSPDYRVFIMDDEKSCDSRYYLHLMQTCYRNKIFYGLGQGVSSLGRWRLQADKFLNFLIPVPSLEEQKAIAEYIDDKCKSIDAAISEKGKVLEKLESYKKSLIYECVTGKREVK